MNKELVYCVFREYDYEITNLLSIYKSKEKAMERVLKEISERKTLKFKYDDKMRWSSTKLDFYISEKEIE